MPRQLDSATISEIGSNQVSLCYLLQITFTTGTVYLTSAPVNLSWNGQTWLGLGSLSSVGPIAEGSDIQAYGCTVTLSGIDPVLIADSLNDIQIGAAATLYVGFLTPAMALVTAPTIIFAGQVDEPTISYGAETVTISLNLESPLIRLQRGSFRRLTAADQRINYPGDSGFDWVPSLNFMALRWGS